MDNLAHSLFGAALANAGLARRCGRGTTLALVLASNVPDLDFLWALGHGGGAQILLSRRMLTHSVVGGPLLALALAACLKPFLKAWSWKGLWGLCLLGIAGHVFLDLLNSFGVLVLYPLSAERVALSWVFIVDPMVWALLAMPLLGLLRPWGRARLEPLSRGVLAALGLYLGLCAAGRYRAEALVRAQEPAAAVRAFPEALGPSRFRAVAREGSRYRLFLVHLLNGRVELRGEAASEDEDPVVRSARSRGNGLDLDRFFRAPVWRRIPGTREAEVHDLQFRSLVLRRETKPFTFRVSEDGTVLQP